MLRLACLLPASQLVLPEGLSAHDFRQAPERAGPKPTRPRLRDARGCGRLPKRLPLHVTALHNLALVGRELRDRRAHPGLELRFRGDLFGIARPLIFEPFPVQLHPSTSTFAPPRPPLANAVDHGSFDANLGPGAKRHPARFVVPSRRLQQALPAKAAQIIQRDKAQIADGPPQHGSARIDHAQGRSKPLENHRVIARSGASRCLHARPQRKARTDKVRGACSRNRARLLTPDPQVGLFPPPPGGSQVVLFPPPPIAQRPIVDASARFRTRLNFRCFSPMSSRPRPRAHRWWLFPHPLGVVYPPSSSVPSPPSRPRARSASRANLRSTFACRAIWLTLPRNCPHSAVK